jgi:hypothetical protein
VSAKSEFMYVAWRWHVWLAGGETYNTIDRKVGDGTMTPGECSCGADDCPYAAARPTYEGKMR